MVKFVLAAALSIVGTITPCWAQIPMATDALDRVEKTELYGIGQYLHSGNINYHSPNGGDLTLKMDDTGLGGFGIAYHFNTFLSVRADFMFGGATFSANVPTDTGGTVGIKQDAFIQTGRVNLDYNMINRRLTPVLTAGIGYQYLEAEIPNSAPITTCWYSPWWGWVCTSGYPVYYETDFTWNAGAGLRWDVTDHFFVKAMAGANWLQYSGGKGITTQIEGIFSIGWTF